MENSDDIRLIVKIAQLYYEQEMTQAQIAQTLGIYRTTISRLLKRGRELGIVSIAINYDYNDSLWLERNQRGAPFIIKRNGNQLEIFQAVNRAQPDEMPMLAAGKRQWLLQHN